MSTMYKHWTDLIKPKQLEVEEKTLTSTYGKFYAEPFEHGFGRDDRQFALDGFSCLRYGRYPSWRCASKGSCMNSPRFQE